ncbi:MAG: hypothetical protein PHD65_05405 [Gallionella sp.]|nr:hypothetical protein [Gallionella sp.]
MTPEEINNAAYIAGYNARRSEGEGYIAARCEELTARVNALTNDKINAEREAAKYKKYYKIYAFLAFFAYFVGQIPYLFPRIFGH